MKIACAVFFGVLVYAHVLSPESIDLPLCLLRDGTMSQLGYALFAALGVVGLVYIGELVRYGQPAEAVLGAFVFAMMLAVAATPSWGLGHSFFAAVTLATLFAYFALLLKRSESPWRLVHFAAPLVLLAATRFESYGLWQKALIAYFVAAAAVHHHFVRRQWLKLSAADANADQFLGRGRVVYKLTPLDL
jgi:hypothetical protein